MHRRRRSLRRTWGRINAAAALQAVNHPYNFVKHSGTPLTTTVDPPNINNAPVIQVYFSNGFGNQSHNNQGPGIYYCQRQTITKTYAYTLPYGSYLADIWPRFSSSFGASYGSINSQNVLVNDQYDLFSELSHSVNSNNVVSVTCTTHVYYIKNKQSGVTLNTWFPGDASQARTAFSMHVSNMPTKVDEVYGVDHFTIYPNPTNNVTALRYEGMSILDPMIEVTDIAGRVVYRELITGNRSTFQVSLPSSHWNGGVYICKLSSKNRPTLTQKLSKY